MEHDFEGRATRRQSSLRLAISLLLTLGLGTSVGCGDDEGNDEGKVDAGDGDGDLNPGDGDGDLTPGDGDGDVTPGDGDGDIGPVLDSGVDASQQPPVDAGSDAGEEPDPVFNPLKPLAYPGSDRFAAVAFSPNGQKIYAVGYITLPTDNAKVLNRAMSVVRFNLDNTLDTTFGEDGILRLDHFVPTGLSDGSEGAKAIAVQDDGKILVAGTYKWSDAFYVLQGPDDKKVMKTVQGYQPQTGVAVIRLNDNGTVDETFNAAGARPGWHFADLGPIFVSAGWNANQKAVTISSRDDDVGGVSVDSHDRVVVFAKAEVNGNADRVIYRLTSDGTLDTSFNTTGSFSFGSSGNENAKQGAILSTAGNEDDILSPGYTSISDKTTIVVGYVESTGSLKSGWGDFTLNTTDDLEDVNGTTGFLASNPFIGDKGFVEAYAAALQNNQTQFVTTGYGYFEELPPSDQPQPPRQLYSFRYSVATGARDANYGNGEGRFTLDEIIAGTVPGNIQGRAAVVLGDDRIVMAGNAQPVKDSATGADGFVALLTEDGELDTSFNTTGVRVWDVGLRSDQFAGLASHGTKVAAVGYAGADATQKTTDDESAIVILDFAP